MKVMLYMAVTLDGFIAKKDDSSDFISKEESASYVSAVKVAGNLVIGRRTYEILSTQPEFQEFKRAKVKIVVVSRSDFKTLSANDTVAHSPQEALGKFSTNENVVVAGGGKLNGSFLEAGLLDELFIDVEPAILGDGIKLFGKNISEVKLNLLGSKEIAPGEIQLHYKVLK